MCPLEYGSHVDAQCDVVVFDALAQTAGVDDVLVVVVRRDVVAACLSQILKYLLSPENLADGERRQPVEVDDALLRLLRAHIPLRPLPYVTVKTDGGDVPARHEEHLVGLGDEVGEGQRGGVGMVHQLAEAHGERTDGRRHEQVTAACRLRAALQYAPVHRPHLVSVVGEIGPRSCIVEREHTADKQRTLVMGGAERTAEGRAGFPVRHERIGEEHAL